MCSSQSSQNLRSEMREDVCTGDSRHWLPVGLVIYQREAREKLGILSYRVSHEETSGTLLENDLGIKHNWESRQVYISPVPRAWGKTVPLIFIVPVFHTMVLYGGCLIDAVNNSQLVFGEKLYNLSSVTIGSTPTNITSNHHSYNWQ